jgi:hypothetical protein
MAVNVWRRGVLGSLALATLSVALVAVLMACKNSADVYITGSMAELSPKDSVYVTLSRNWERETVSPASFSVDPGGQFALRIDITGRPPPITFVRNGELLARLEFKDTWGYTPVLRDKVGGKEFPVEVVSESFLRAKVLLR